MASTQLEMLPVEPPRQITPMELIQSAIQQGAGIDTIERLAKLQREMVEYQAKVEFNDAMHRAQDAMKPIGADAVNPQTKSKYATYAKLDKALRPIYTNEGFALSFNTTDCPIPDHVRVLCEVTRGGYAKPYQIDMPNDGKGAKGGDVMTKTHATGAGVSYGMRYLLKMIFNVAVGETDKDGNTEVHLAEEKVVEFLDFIREARDEDELKRFYIAAQTEAQLVGDSESLRVFAEAKNKRWRQLHPKPEGAR